MTPVEFVLALEEQWTPLTPEQQRIYHNKLGRFSPDQLYEIFDELLDNCKYKPKIADIIDAARELSFLQKSRERRTLGRKRCTTCEETGFRYIAQAVTMPDGVTFLPSKAVVVCECRHRGRTLREGI